MKQKKLLARIVKLEEDIEQLEEVRLELLKSGYASATMSSGGGSRSYTRMDVGKITEAIREMKSEIRSCRKMLLGASPISPAQIFTVYS